MLNTLYIGKAIYTGKGDTIRKSQGANSVHNGSTKSNQSLFHSLKINRACHQGIKQKKGDLHDLSKHLQN